MKGKLLLVGIAVLAMASCNDDMQSVGSTIQPDGDKIIPYSDSIQLKAETIKIDSIYAKSSVGLLGVFNDPTFGELKSDYLCQFYCPDNFKFKNTPDFGKIDSVEFKIVYYNSLGDTLTPMQASIYQASKVLNKDFYTNINPSDYCDLQTLLGKKRYSAYDQSIPDSIRKLSSFVPTVTIPFSQEFGQNFYKATLEHPEYFKNQESFNKYFKGVYVTTTFGEGNILYVSETSLSFFYKHTVNDKTTDGRDTSYIKKAVEKFVVTPEVIQLNQFKNSGFEALLGEHERINYQKTPAGVFTKITIPLKDIAKTVEGRILNNMAFSLKVLPPEDDMAFSLTKITPDYALLVPLDSMNTFFRNKQVENNSTSFLSASYSETYKNTGIRVYNFSNISGILKDRIEYAKKNGTEVEDHIEMVIVPVTRKTAQNYYQTTYTTALYNFLSPSGTKLVSDTSALKLQILSSKYNRPLK